ncbi:unnamed protein product [Notodromas monacha]|uniref:V-type proton ATPase subunit a n=1 Tax=Notodromas monacha TaxID=399045 RepID=A0A7R9BL74_9CRUS|nr:unnamed protein product [Notodromas monacha]CAG0916167.1 unnamed protein product [Notodromas monacha]
MASPFRSEDMMLCQLYLQAESGYSCVAELGELGLVEFRDLNAEENLFSRQHVSEVRRAEEMLRKLRYLEKQILEADVPIPNRNLDYNAPDSGEIGDMESDDNKRRSIISASITLDPEDDIIGSHLGFVAGTLPRERLQTFELLLWRACRGNVFLKVIDVPGEVFDPASVLSQTEEYRFRVLNAAAKSLDSWFIRVNKMKAIYHTLNKFMVNKMKAIYHTLNKFMYDFAPECIVAECWIPTSSLEEVQNSLVTGMVRSGGTIAPIINRIATDEVHPTFNRTNRLTQGFQSLVDAYGVADYKEMNPAIFAVITFPFLFGVMFGDIGHGLIMAAFGAYLVWKEDMLESVARSNEIAQMFFGGRYIIMLMGIFGTYAGFIYNDIFGKTIKIFPSGFTYHTFNLQQLTKEEHLGVDPAVHYKGVPYPFGVDPVWGMATNKITYLNSFKMKTAVVLGVMQMLFGVVLSLTNHTYYRKPLNIWAEFVPQLLFMLCMFGYLVVLVFLKWVKYDVSDSSCAPSILITFINMVLFKAPAKIENCESTMFPGQVELQMFLLLVALICVPWMLLVKPFVLRKRHLKALRSRTREQEEERSHRDRRGPDDLYELSHSFEALQTAQQAQAHNLLEQHRGSAEVIEVESEVTDTEFDFSEVFINQAIHTIEFVLGSVSHTASYLRLWALSLAHNQLDREKEQLLQRVKRRARSVGNRSTGGFNGPGDRAEPPPIPWSGFGRFLGSSIPPQAFLVPYHYCFKSPFCAMRSFACFFSRNWDWVLQWMVFAFIVYTVYWALVPHLRLAPNDAPSKAPCTACPGSDGEKDRVIRQEECRVLHDHHSADSSPKHHHHHEGIKPGQAVVTIRKGASSRVIVI